MDPITVNAAATEKFLYRIEFGASFTSQMIPFARLLRQDCAVQSLHDSPDQVPALFHKFVQLMNVGSLVSCEQVVMSPLGYAPRPGTFALPRLHRLKFPAVSQDGDEPAPSAVSHTQALADSLVASTASMRAALTRSMKSSLWARA